MVIGTKISDEISDAGISVEVINLTKDESDEFAARYLGDAKQAYYLMRPDQHVAARWTSYDKAAVIAALKIATARV